MVTINYRAHHAYVLLIEFSLIATPTLNINNAIGMLDVEIRVGPPQVPVSATRCRQERIREGLRVHHHFHLAISHLLGLTCNSVEQEIAASCGSVDAIDHVCVSHARFVVDRVAKDEGMGSADTEAGPLRVNEADATFVCEGVCPIRFLFSSSSSCSCEAFRGLTDCWRLAGVKHGRQDLLMNASD